MRIKGIMYTVISAVLFGITPILATAIYQQGANPLTVVFFRSLIVLPILYILMRVQHVSLHITRHNLKNVAYIAIFGSGLTTILLFSSYSYIEVGSATTLHFLYPIVVSILCFFIYKEKLGKTKILALTMALLGTLCFFDFSQLDHVFGIFLAILSAITYAFYMVQTEKTNLVHENAYKISFYLAAFIVIETFVLQFVQTRISFILPMNAYFLLLLLAIVSSFLAVVLLQQGMKYLGSSTASLFCLFEPITSILCGYLFLQEQITAIKIIGCVIIFSSLIMISYGERRKSKKQTT